MTYSRRSLLAAATTTLILLGSSALFAQESGTVGPPVLKDFQLPGERTTPPAQTPPEPKAQPKAETPPPAAQRPQAAETPRRDPAPARAAPKAAPTPATEAPAPAQAAEAPAPAAQAPIPALPAPVPQQAPPASAAPAPPAPQQDGSWSGLWLVIPAALGLIAFFAFGRQRRPRRKQAVAARRPAAAAAPPAAPPPPAPRARLEIEFRPERAAATPTAALVQFEFVLRNQGGAIARNIRIDARLFNASENKQALEFLKGDIHERSGSPHVTIAPGAEFRIPMEIALPNDQVREILVEGRRLFVPLLASNIAWDWEGGTDRQSFSWIVGREPSTPSAKMGGFRLDLGPRIYRQVAQRPMKLVA
jgi:hypothetical protein